MTSLATDIVEVPSHSRSNFATYAVLALVVIAGLALRLLVIGESQANFDESHTSLTAQSGGIAALMDGLLSDVHPPVYFLLMMGWVKVFGTSELALRFPSMLAGLALVPLTYALTRSFGGRAIWSIAAAAMISLTPIFIYYSVEARSYSIFWLLTTAAVLLLRRGLDSDDRICWWWACASTVVAFYTHLFAIFLLVPWLVTLFAAQPRQRSLIVKIGSVGFLLAIPWAIVTASHQGSGIDWISWVWRGVPSSLWGSIKVATLSAPFPQYLGRLAGTTYSEALSTVFLLWFGLPVLIGLIYCASDRSAENSGKIPKQLLLPAACLAPPLGLALLSLHQPLYVVGRYELMAYPFWVALWALGLQSLSLRLKDERLRRTYTIAACVVTLLCVSIATQRYLAVPAREWYFRDTAEFLRDSSDGDVIVAVGLLRGPMEHQLRRIGDRHELLSFPFHVADHIGWMDYSMSSSMLSEEAARLSAHLADRKTIWILARHDGRGNLVLPDIPKSLIDTLLTHGREITAARIFGFVMALRLDLVDGLGTSAS